MAISGMGILATAFALGGCALLIVALVLVAWAISSNRSSTPPRP
jgi:hypothetical protein